MHHSSESPLNTSKTKSMYSFSKAKRFQNSTNPYCDSFYKVPEAFSKRSTSLGYGKRFAHFVSKSIAPGPQQYTLSNTRSSTAFSFGVSRDKFQKVYIKENPPRDKSIPGPAAYNAKMSYTEKQAAAYSLRPMTAYSSMFNDPTKNNPGPGQYNSQQASENKNGFYVNSRYKSPGRAIISGQGKRFDNNDIKRSRSIPGPGQYNSKPQKTWRSNGNTVIGTSKRIEIINQSGRKTPGPGQYRAQSDFGYYDPQDSFNTNGSVMLRKSTYK